MSDNQVNMMQVDRLVVGNRWNQHKYYLQVEFNCTVAEENQDRKAQLFV